MKKTYCDFCGEKIADKEELKNKIACNSELLRKDDRFKKIASEGQKTWGSFIYVCNPCMTKFLEFLLEATGWQK